MEVEVFVMEGVGEEEEEAGAAGPAGSAAAPPAAVAAAASNSGLCLAWATGEGEVEEEERASLGPLEESASGARGVRPAPTLGGI